ncbi:DUF4189 domain-containing protein [Lysobacter tyrosinilyticus]
MYPGGAQPSGPICVPIPGAGGGSGEQRPAQRWEERWGAIATDAKNGYMGVAVDQRSKYIAQATALTQCRDFGGSDCIISATYANGCAVLATGNDKYLIKVGSTVVEATELAFEACEKSGMDCTIPYSACSLAKRTQ